MGGIGSGVSWSLRFLVRVLGGGATGVEGGESSGGAVGVACVGFWGAGEWRHVLWFPFRVITAGVPGSVGAVLQVLGVASFLVTPGVWVGSSRGMFESGGASSVFFSELPPASVEWLSKQ